MLDVLLSFNPINNKLVIDNNLLTIKKKSFFDRINIFWKPQNERIQTIADHIFTILDDQSIDVSRLFNSQDKLARVFQKVNYLFSKLDHKTKNGDQYQNKLFQKQIDFFHRLNAHEIQHKESTLASLSSTYSETTQKIEELRKQNLQIQEESQKQNSQIQSDINKNKETLLATRIQLDELENKKTQRDSEIQALQTKLTELQCDTIVWTNNGYLLINSSLYPKLKVLHSDAIQKAKKIPNIAIKTLEALEEYSPEKLEQLKPFKHIDVPFDFNTVCNFFEYIKNSKLKFTNSMLEDFKKIHAYLGGDPNDKKLFEKPIKVNKYEIAYTNLRQRMRTINLEVEGKLMNFAANDKDKLKNFLSYIYELTL